MASKIDSTLQQWLDARKRHGLSHAHVQMARELGMLPKSLAPLANTGQAQWKAPLPEFIERQYQRRFGRERPDVVQSIEDRAKDIAARKAVKAEKKARRRASRATDSSTAPTDDAPQGDVP